MIRKLFSHTVIYGSAPYVSKIASFFILPIITQYLTPIDYGVYGVVTALTGALSVLASLGLRLILVNSFYRSPNRYRWVWRQLYGFLTLWIFPYALLSVLLVYFVIPEEAKHQVWLILFLNLVPALLFGQAATLATTYYQINKKPMPIAIRTAIFGVLTVLLNWYTIAELRLGYMGWFWSNFIIGLLSNMSYWLALNFKYRITPIFNFKWRLIKNSLKVSLPTVPHYYSGYLLNSSDKVVLELVQVSTANIGKYNAAYTFGNYFSNLGNASGLAVGPLLNECYKAGNDRLARNLIFLQQIVFLMISFLVSIWLKEIFHFFIKNEELNKMYYLGVIVVMAYNYRPMYMGANAKLFFAEKTKVLWKVSFIAGLGNVILNLICIPMFGYEAAAYTTFVSLMYMGYSGYFLNAFKKENDVNYYPMLWLIGTTLLTAIGYVSVEFSAIKKILITAIIIPISAFSMIRLRRMIHDKKRGN